MDEEIDYSRIVSAQNEEARRLKIRKLENDEVVELTNPEELEKIIKIISSHLK